MLKRKGRIRLFRGSIEFQKPIRETDPCANMMRFVHTYKGVMKTRWFCVLRILRKLPVYRWSNALTSEAFAAFI